jgi:D-amino-acid dehydrogenase
LPLHTEILIVGGGAAGVCCAHYLHAAGCAVTLVDQAEICAGASYGNAGLIAASHCEPLPAPGMIARALQWLLDPESPFYIKPRPDIDLLQWLWQFRGHCNHSHLHRALPILKDLNAASLQLFNELAATEDLDIGFRQSGQATLYASRPGLADGIEKSRLLAQFGIESRPFSGDAVRTYAGGQRCLAVGGIYYPQDARVSPDRFVRALAHRLQARGVPLLTSTEVIGFLTAGRRIRAVETTRGQIAAERVVVAGGAWTPRIARQLNLRLWWIQPAKGYSLTYDRPENAPEIPLMLAESKVAVVPMDDGLRLAGTLELAGFDFSINRRRISAITKAVRRCLPDFDPASFRLREIWRGMRPCTPDGLPCIGRSKHWDNLLIAGGHGTLGILQSPATGKLISQLVTGEPPLMDVAPLRPERF